MPPDANKSREFDVASSSSSNDLLRYSTMQDVKDDQVVIDGVVYDISNFDHPGGDQMKMFGGNDVTVPFKMIHPHSTKTSLERALPRVGKIEDYQESEYEFGTPFEVEMKKEVFQIVRRGKEFATTGFYFRLAVYTSIYFVLMYHWVTVRDNSYALAILFGISQATMGLNVQHDANHGAISKRRPWINDMFGLFADFIGYCKYLWLEQHWTHHAFTNHVEKDPDASAGEPAMIFYNYHAKHASRSWFHKFQAVFFLPLFCFYWFTTAFNLQQVWHLNHEGTDGAGMNFASGYVKSRRKYALSMRIMYLLIHVMTPLVNRGWTFETLWNIWIMGVAGSLALAVPFSLSHNFCGVEREPVAQNAKSCWFTSQVETSCTYGGCVAGWLTGGLNYQIEHHLFPRMSSAWYPYIAPTVRRVCEKHNVQYTYYPTILHNLYSTIRYMHKVGNNQEHDRKMK